MDKHTIFEWVDRDRDMLADISEQIWENPELGLHEHKAAKLLVEKLREEGFSVEEGIGGMPTAFVASYGTEGPDIGILGEYDALPGLSQRESINRDSIEQGAPGHGCGHNLFAVGSLGGAIAIKHAIESRQLEGSIHYFGCPAEETLIGKVFMARAGVFDDMDAVLAWHPSDLSTPWMGRSLALDSLEFTFNGTSAHAAGAPESGRSALDAVQLFNTGIEYMREHISEEARIHYVITEGGEAPNVVPATASVWLYVRAPDRRKVERISAWVRDIAAGSALMTETDMNEHYLTGCYDYLPNDTISQMLWENMQELGSIDFSADEQAFAAELRSTIDDESINTQLADLPEDLRGKIRPHDLYGNPVPAFDTGNTGTGSTDVGDVSWIAPTGQFRAASFPVGTPGHSWQIVAANAKFGIKGALYASKVFGGTAWDLLSDPQILERAQEEFQAEIGGRSYQTPLPDGATPPTDMVYKG